jgi:hypothetical protein
MSPTKKFTNDTKGDGCKHFAVVSYSLSKKPNSTNVAHVIKLFTAVSYDFS